MLWNNSQITTSAGGNGGNIRINGGSIVAVPTENSDIRANSVNARGGNGTVQLNIDLLDPTSGLVALPTTVVDSSRLIAQGCPANQGNSFVISGRGGLPPTPEQQLDDDAEWGDRRRLTVVQQAVSRVGVRRQKPEVRINSELKTLPDTRHSAPGTPIIEATGWQVTPTGAIVLVATTPVPTVQNRLPQLIVCPVRQ